MPARLRYITSSPRRLVTLLAVTLLGFALVATAARASGVAFFGGGDAGVQTARTGIASVPIGASVSVQGVTVTITGFAADDTRTVIGLDVEGRPELGPGVMPLGSDSTQLVDQDGRIYREDAGTADTANPRLVTRYFPALDPASKQLTLQINGIQFSELTGRPTENGRLNAQWTVRFDLPAAPSKSVDVPADHTPRALGKGQIVIDTIQQAASGTVIDGHLAGFTMDDIPEFGIPGTLVLQDGTKVAFIGLRMGYGTDRSQWEMRFPPTSGAVQLQINGSASDPLHPATTAALQESFTATGPATWELALPGSKG
jgi:hypothetical protein